MPETTPPDPFTQLAEGAAQHHEFVTTYTAAGFTRAEAMELLIAILTTFISHNLQGGVA